VKAVGGGGGGEGPVGVGAAPDGTVSVLVQPREKAKGIAALMELSWQHFMEPRLWSRQ
jgi:hypothetical protein